MTDAGLYPKYEIGINNFLYFATKNWLVTLDREVCAEILTMNVNLSLYLQQVFYCVFCEILSQKRDTIMCQSSTIIIIIAVVEAAVVNVNIYVILNLFANV